MTILTKNFADLKATVEAHVKADAVVQGQYWAEGKGCFIGCLAHGDDVFSNEERFGLPIMVQRIAENIFEALPGEEAKEFFAALPEAVEKDGKDLSRVGWAFLASELRSLPVSSPEIETVIAGLDLLAEGNQWAAAADADAYAAARAADAAARAAARAAAYAAAADAAVRLRQRGLLLRLIKEA